MDNADTTSDLQTKPYHACIVCGAHACFGFNTRDGSVWTCQDHRDAGERILTSRPHCTGGQRRQVGS